MKNLCVNKKEAGEIIGVSVRQIDYYLASGTLTVDHMEKHRVMINISKVFELRENRKQRKRGK